MAAPANPTTRPLVLTDVFVVDPTDGSVTRGRDVTTAGGRIVSIEATGAASPDADMVDAGGKFVVPGYVDMHAHPLNRSDPTGALELMFAFGITGFRQMSGSLDLLRRRREGTLAFSARSPQLLATPGDVLTPMNAKNPEAAEATVREHAAAGADFMKAVFMSPEAFFAAQRTAAEVGLPVVGHLPTGIDVRTASRTGMRSIEHVGPGIAIPSACCAEEVAIQASIPPGAKIKLPPFKLPFQDHIFSWLLAKVVLNPMQRTKPAEVTNFRSALDSYDEGKARELARLFAANETWQCPTLIRMRSQELCGHADFRSDPDLRYMSAPTMKTWGRAADSFNKKFSAQDRETFEELYGLQQRLVAIFDEEGVPLLAGTDAGGGVWVVPGSSLHREFDELASSGLSPLRILQTTTIDPARFLGIEADAGTVAPGKRADLVLLDADPTLDLAHLHGIAGVVRAGKHYTAADLDRLKASIVASGGVD